jgi:hypothetical protein
VCYELNIIFSQYEVNCEMNEVRITQANFFRSRIHQSEGHVTLKYVGTGVGRPQILT